MLFYSVAVIILVATSIATPPPGYVKQPDNDKKPPEYQFNYEVGDVVGKSHGKVEARSGELASGRYYVNSEQSSTDVKYFADEWGYHPLVKYRSSNEHSTGGARFAVGEEAVKSLQNDDDGRQETRTSPEEQQFRSVQIIQPYTLHKEEDETLKSREPDQSILGDNMDVKASSLLESNISEESRNINYANLPQRQTLEVISLNGIPLGDGSTASYSATLPVIVHSAVTTARTSPADVSYVRDTTDNKKDLLSAISEDQLYIENAGSFGQRLRVSSSDSLQEDASYSSTTTVASQSDTASSPRENENLQNLSRNRYSLKPYSATIKKNRKIQGVRLYNVGSSGHVDVTEEPGHGFNRFSSTTLSPTASTTIDQYLSTSPLQDFSNAIETSQKKISSTTESSSFGESKIELSNPEQINYALLSGEGDKSRSLGLSAPGNENLTFEFKGNIETNRVTSIPKTTDGFSKPIVVAEVSRHKPFEYSTTFECEDNIVSSTPSTIYSTTLRPIASSNVVATSKGENKGYDTISSIILNPIQAGVSLVNAGEAHLISGDSDLNIAPVEEKVDENVDFSVSEEKAQSQVVYEKVNSAFGEEDHRLLEETREIVTPSPNQGIEIQKSVEIYHNAPVQEIHYPPQMVSQVIHIDQFPGGQQYIAENVQNAKQHQRSESPTTNTAYEINHDASNIYQNIPEDKMQSQHVYVLNQEYSTDDENAAQTNSILQSGAQRYYHIYPLVQENNGGRYFDSAAMNTIRVGVESQQVDEPTASFQSYRSYDNGASYSTDINHGQQQIAVAVPHTDSQNIVHLQSGSKTLVEVQPSYQIELEKSPPIQQTVEIQVPVEQEITQNQKDSDTRTSDIQPNKVEKIIEKTVRIPQPYPVEIETIIEKKVPVPVEKIIEKKIPVPHLYPVHIQIPIERIIEKRIPIPQPFPVPVEKIVEKKIPIPVQKIIPQPIPVPVKVPQPYTIEKVVEKPVHIPVPVEKLVEKKVPVPQPYPIEIEKIVERKVPIPVEVTKYVEKPVPVHVPYGVQYGVSYQQIMKPQNHNLYSTHAATSVPLYGLSVIKNQNVYNLTQPFQGYIYPKPFIGFVEGKNNANPYYGAKQGVNSGKKHFFSHFTFASQPTIMQSYSGYNLGHHRKHTLHRMPTKEKTEKDGYIGRVPLQHTAGITHHNQGQQHGFQAKSSFHSTSATRSPGPVTTLRKVRQQDPYHHVGKGSFRQSKMEYGFKPPMIPSVQYDEETASKVES